MINSKLIGEKIALARKKHNLSQAELALKISISAQAVGKWERGESLPDITTLIRLAEIMGVDLNYFSERFLSANAENSTNEEIQKQPAAKKEKMLGWNMSEGNWLNADFSGLKNLHEKFSSSNMKNCKFVGSSLSGLLLKGNNIDGCDFSHSDISNSQIQGSNLGNNLFNNCSLQGAAFVKSNIEKCDFTDADFTEATFKASNFAKNTLANARFKNTLFTETAIDETVFSGTLEDCTFENCAFYRVKFEQATLKNTFFKNNKNLKRITFTDCKADRITYEFLKSGKADLTGITLIMDR